jgi:hypothetical protein
MRLGRVDGNVPTSLRILGRQMEIDTVFTCVEQQVERMMLIF